MWQAELSGMLFLGLFFNPEDGNYMSLRNAGKRSTE
jgi:hypothetical protein